MGRDFQSVLQIPGDHGELAITTEVRGVFPFILSRYIIKKWAPIEKPTPMRMAEGYLSWT